MNNNQRIILLIMMVAFGISIFYVPESAVMSDGKIINLGWQYIWQLTYDVNLKILLIEWLGILVMGFGTFFLVKK